MDMNELKMNELEQVTGGNNDGGYEYYPREKAGCFIYQVRHNDNLSKLAGRYGTSVNRIMAVNPELVDPNFIVTGHYIYIPD